MSKPPPLSPRFNEAESREWLEDFRKLLRGSPDDAQAVVYRWEKRVTSRGGELPPPHEDQALYAQAVRTRALAQAPEAPSTASEITLLVWLTPEHQVDAIARQDSDEGWGTGTTRPEAIDAALRDLFLCEESWSPISWVVDQTHMTCWGCGANVKIEANQGMSYRLAEHESEIRLPQVTYSSQTETTETTDV